MTRSLDEDYDVEEFEIEEFEEPEAEAYEEVVEGGGEELVEWTDEEGEDEYDESGKKRKHWHKKHTMVFDETAGRIVAKRKRKPSRRQDIWEVEED